MKIEQALIEAIEYETRIRDIYVEALDETDNPAAKSIYKLMADEEQGHVLYLESRLEKWKSTGDISEEELSTAVPPMDEIQREIEKISDQMISGDSADDIKALEKALSAEGETLEFYQRLTAELPKEAKGLFERFIEIEQGHVELVKAELDALKKNGFWFGAPEFDLEVQ